MKTQGITDRYRPMAIGGAELRCQGSLEELRRRACNDYALTRQLVNRIAREHNFWLPDDGQNISKIMLRNASLGN
jgi:hypothetical protein